MTDARAADDWWATLPPKRRSQIHHWIVAPDDDPGELPGQMTLIDPKDTA